MKDLLLKSITHFLEASIPVKILIAGILMVLIYFFMPLFVIGWNIAFTLLSTVIGLGIWALGFIVLFVIVLAIWTGVPQLLGRRGSITKYGRRKRN